MLSGSEGRSGETVIEDQPASRVPLPVAPTSLRSVGDRASLRRLPDLRLVDGVCVGPDSFTPVGTKQRSRGTALMDGWPASLRSMTRRRPSPLPSTYASVLGAAYRAGGCVFGPLRPRTRGFLSVDDASMTSFTTSGAHGAAGAGRVTAARGPRGRGRRCQVSRTARLPRRLARTVPSPCAATTHTPRCG